MTGNIEFIKNSTGYELRSKKDKTVYIGELLVARTMDGNMGWLFTSTTCGLGIESMTEITDSLIELSKSNIEG